MVIKQQQKQNKNKIENNKMVAVHFPVFPMVFAQLLMKPTTKIKNLPRLDPKFFQKRGYT